jgi:hypothetical protein
MGLTIADTCVTGGDLEIPDSISARARNAATLVSLLVVARVN